MRLLSTRSLFVTATILLGLAGADAPGQETPIARERRLLKGTWTLVSLQDDGENYGPELIREKIAADGRITIGDRLYKFTGALDGKPRTYAYRLEVQKDPKGIELIDESDEVMRGIYAFVGDQLVICVRRESDIDAPPIRELSAPPGSGTMLMTLRIVPAEVLAQEAKDREEAEANRFHERRTVLSRDPQSEPRPQPTTAPAAVAAPSIEPPPAREADEVASPAPAQAQPGRPSIVVMTDPALPASTPSARDLAISKMLVGTWTHTDSRGSVMAQYNDNGTFKTTRRWNTTSDHFVSGPTTSVGTWYYEGGYVTTHVGASTDPKMVGQALRRRVHSVGEQSVTVIDTLGRIVQDTRVR